MCASSNIINTLILNILSSHSDTYGCLVVVCNRLTNEKTTWLNQPQKFILKSKRGKLICRGLASSDDGETAAGVWGAGAACWVAAAADLEWEPEVGDTELAVTG